MPDPVLPVPPVLPASTGTTFELPKPSVGPIEPPGFRYYSTARDVVDGVSVGLVLSVAFRGPSVWDTLPRYLHSRRLDEFAGLSTSDKYRYDIVRRLQARWSAGDKRIVDAVIAVLATRGGNAQTVKLQQLVGGELAKTWPGLSDGVADTIRKHIASLIAEHTTVGVYRGAAELLDGTGLARELLRQARIEGLTPEEQDLYRRAAEYYLDGAIKQSKAQEGSESASMEAIQRNLASVGAPAQSLRSAIDAAKAELGTVMEAASEAIRQQAQAELREAVAFAAALRESTYSKEDAAAFLGKLAAYDEAARVAGPRSERAIALRRELEQLEAKTIEEYETVRQALATTSDGVALLARVLVAFDPDHGDRYARAARAAQAGLRAAAAIHELTSRSLPFALAAGQYVALGAAAFDLFLALSAGGPDADEVILRQLDALSGQIEAFREQMVARLDRIEATLDYHFRTFMAQFAQIHQEQAAAARRIDLLVTQSLEIQLQQDRLLGFVIEVDLQADRREIDALRARVRDAYSAHVQYRLYAGLSLEGRLEKYIEATADFLATLLEEASAEGLAGKRGQRLADIHPKISMFGLDFYINTAAEFARGSGSPRLVNAVVWTETLACWLAMEATYPDLPGAPRLAGMPDAVTQLRAQLDDLAGFVRDVQSRPSLIDEAIRAYRLALGAVFDALEAQAEDLAARIRQRETCQAMCVVLSGHLPDDAEVSQWARWLREIRDLPIPRVDLAALDRLEHALRQRLLDIEVILPVRTAEGLAWNRFDDIVRTFVGEPIVIVWPHKDAHEALHAQWVRRLGSERRVRGIYGLVPVAGWEWMAASEKTLDLFIAPLSQGIGEFESADRLDYFGLTPSSGSASVGGATVVVTFGPTILGTQAYPAIDFVEVVRVATPEGVEPGWTVDVGARHARIDSVQAAGTRPTPPRDATEYQPIGIEWVGFLCADVRAVLFEDQLDEAERELERLVAAVELLAADGLGSRALRRAVSLARFAGRSDARWFRRLGAYLREVGAAAGGVALPELSPEPQDDVSRLLERAVARLAQEPAPSAGAVGALTEVRARATVVVSRLGGIVGWPPAEGPGPTLLLALADLIDLFAFCRLATEKIERARDSATWFRALTASEKNGWERPRGLDEATDAVATWQASSRRRAEVETLLALRDEGATSEQRRLGELVRALEHARRHIEIWVQIAFNRSATNEPALVRCFTGATQLWGTEVMGSVCRDAAVGPDGVLVTDFQARRHVGFRRVCELEDVLAELEAGDPEPYLPLALGRRLLDDHVGPG